LMARWLGGSPVDGVTAHQLGGSTVQWFDGRRHVCLTDRRLDSSLA
jgi:hypothetical protein